MKRIKYLITTMVLIFFCIISTRSFATDLNKEANLKDTEKYFFSQEVSSDETLNHSVFVAGSNVKSKVANIKGILFAAGNNVTINSNTDYAFIAGNNIAINEKTNNDLFVAGNNISINDTASINRDLYAAGNEIFINSNIEGKVFASGSKIIFQNVDIKSNVNINADEIIFIGDVSIDGTLKYNENATITGENNLKVENKETYVQKETKTNETKDKITNTIIEIAGLFVTAIIINLIFPNIYKKMNKQIHIKEKLKELGIGLICLIVIPIISIIVCVTIIGIKLGLIIIALYCISLYLAIIPSMVILGNVINTKLLKLKENFYLDALVGIIILELVSLIPYVGGWIYFIFLLIGTGIVYKDIRTLTSKKDAENK